MGWLSATGLLSLALALGWPALSRAQTQPGEAPPVDPEQLKSQLSQSLVRLVLDRPVALGQQAAVAAVESGQLAQQLGAFLSRGQGPNGGGLPLGLDVEVGQTAAAAAQCAQQAQQNLRLAGQELELLKGILGGQLDLDGEPGPDSALQIMRWVPTVVLVQRQRNAAIEQCVQDSLIGLGRLRAYRSLYPG
jgi:hypothetical protein